MAASPILDVPVEYEAIFRENKIDETVLPKLTADDLKELGVSRAW
jgi:SAM domain (Sterile alpha motif)